MSEENLKRIIVTVAGRNFPVKVKDENEHIVRTIEKEVNQKINELQVTYSGKDIQDYMSLAILSYASELQRVKESEDLKILDDRLSDLESLFKN